MARLAIVLAAAALAACAPANAPPMDGNASVTEAVPAPTPADITVRIGAEQAGAVVSVPVGQRFAIELVGAPTAGYVWAPAALPSFISQAEDITGPTTRVQNRPGFAGGNHWEVTVFKVEGRGMGEIRMEQRRPWETNEEPSATFNVTIDAR